MTFPLEVGFGSGFESAAEVAGMLMVMVAVEALVPSGVTVAGLTLHVAPWGAPVQVSEVCWLNPLTGVMVTPDVTDGEAFVAVPLEAARLSVKSAGSAAVITIVAAAD